MTDINRLRGMMGLCVRARQGVFGMDGCLNGIRGGKVGLVLMDAEASAGTAKKLQDACHSHQIPLRVIPEGVLQEATGRSGIVMAVNPGGLCDQLLSITEEA